MKFRYMESLVFIAIFPALCVAQGNDLLDSSKADVRLKELREQIQRLESQIASTNAQEVDLLSELDQLDRNISLRHSVINTLEKERNRLDANVQRTGQQIRNRKKDINQLVRHRSEIRQEYNALHEVVLKRAVYVYKHWNVDQLTVLLGAKSLPDLLSRQYYMRKIHYWDTKHLEDLARWADSLKSIEGNIQTEQRGLEEDLERQETTRNQKTALLAQKQNEESALVHKKKERASVLVDVRKDRKALEERLQQTRQAAQEVEKSIASMESRRVPVAPPPGYFTSGLPFASLKGKLPWPIPGKIVTRFGRYKHPQLGTITENTGIDIEVSKGTPVRAVSDARVGMVTWLRGFGNTIILDHQDGHYSVYAHLDEVNVVQDEWLRAGDVIGTAGDTGSLAGPRLHFEIWNKRDIQNPEDWLSKAPYP